MGGILHMKKGLFVLLLISLLVFLSACEANLNETNSDLKKYVHEETGVSFLYPNAWKALAPDEMPEELKGLFSQVEVAILADDDSGANVNLTITKSPMLAPGALEQVEAIESMYELMGNQLGIKEYKRLDLQEYTVGKFNAAILKYEISASQTNGTAIGKQLIVPVGQNTYTLTCTAGKEQWEKYEPIFDVIIKSFSLD